MKFRLDLKERMGTFLYLICMLIYTFFVYVDSDRISNINVFHFKIGILPIYIVLFISFVFIIFMFIFVPRIKVDSIIIILIFRILLNILSSFISGFGQHFYINIVTSILCAIFYIFGFNCTNDKKFVVLVSKIIFFVIFMQVLFEVIKSPISFFSNTYIYKNMLAIPIGSSNAIISKTLPNYALIYSTAKNKKTKYVYTLMMFFIAIVTKSRSGIIAVVIIFSVLLTWKDQLNLRKTIKLLLTMLLLLIVLLIFVKYSDIGEYAFELSNITVVERIYLWKKAFSIFNSSPIFGSGFSNEVTSFDPHNYIMSILMRSGLFGIGILCILILLILLRIKEKTNDAYVRGSVCLCICILMQGLAEVVLFSYIIDMMLWFNIGSMIDYCDRNKDK